MKKNNSLFIYFAGAVYLASLVGGIVISVAQKNALWFLLAFLGGLAVAAIILRVGFKVSN